MHFSIVSIGTNTGASGATLAITVGAAGVPAGAAIFVCVTEKSTSGTDGTLADTAGNTYSKITSGSLAATAADGRGIVFAVTNCKALVNTNTITYTRNLSASSCAISAFYVTGATGAATFTEALATATGTTGTITVTSGSLGVGRLVVGVLCASGTSVAGGNATFANPSGFNTPPVQATTGGSGGSRAAGGNSFKAASGTQVYAPTLSSTAQQWFLAVFGVIPVPDAEELLDLPPTGAAPPYSDPTLRTWSQSLAQFLAPPPAVDSMPGPIDWGDAPGPVYWNNFWAQSIAIYAPIATSPFNQDDWPLLRGYEYQVDLRDWAWKYNPNLIGQDQLPSGDQSLALAPGQVPPEQVQLHSWQWSYNLNLVGRDRLPVGDQYLALPTPAAEYHVQLRTWIQPAITIERVEITPFAQLDWPNPRAPLQPAQTWTWNYNLNLVGQDALPNRQQDWANPVPVQWYRDWSINLLESTLFVKTVPFAQFDWPVPIAPLRIDEGFTASYNRNLIGQDQLPFRQLDWPTTPVPQRAIDLNTWIDRVRLLLAVPLRQLDWPNPIQPPTQVQTWLNTFIPPSAISPFKQLDWPLTLVAAQPDRGFATSFNRNLVGQDKLPIRQLDWPNPNLGPMQPDIRTFGAFNIELFPPPAPVTPTLLLRTLVGTGV